MNFTFDSNFTIQRSCWAIVPCTLWFFIKSRTDIQWARIMLSKWNVELLRLVDLTKMADYICRWYWIYGTHYRNRSSSACDVELKASRKPM